MPTKLVIAVIAVILTLIGYFPYFRDILRKKTTPHLYTWLVWSLTQGTGAVAALYGGAKFGAATLVIGAILVIVIFLLSFKYGTKNITRTDTLSLIVALLAILVWWLLHNPVLSVLMITGIDAIGYIPTLRKSYQEPWSETLWFWALMLIVNILSIAATNQYNLLTVTYPVMLAIGNFTVWTVCLLRRKVIL